MNDVPIASASPFSIAADGKDRGLNADGSDQGNPNPVGS